MHVEGIAGPNRPRPTLASVEESVEKGLACSRHVETSTLYFSSPYKQQ